MPTAPDATFRELMARQEALVPELRAYFSDDGRFPMVRHPLVYSVPHAPQLNAFANAALRAKRDIATAMLQAKEFDRYVFLHERPWRLQAFEGIQARLDDTQYWALLRQVYQDSENVEELAAPWRRALLAPRPQRAAMMSETERAFLGQQREVLTIWRGAADRAELEAGFGWSLSQRVARWFARRFAAGDGALVAKATVPRDQAIAYLATRSEAEIVVAFEQVSVVSVRRV